MRPTALLLETFKRAQHGLYAGEHIRFGNQVSEMGNKTRRTWKPNAQHVPLWSEMLQEKLRVRLTTTALELVDKAGGLDSYILGQRIPESRYAFNLKARILKRKLELENESLPPVGPI
jgi:large subunit ribosomal protein L28